MYALFFVLCLSAVSSKSIWSHVKEAPGVDYHWFTQPLDHFNTSNRQTWQQKYLVNPEHWGGEGYPVFLLLGGEGPVANSSVTGHFVLNEYARKFKAMIVSVEHRFYGDSMPTSDLSLPNLVYLTSEQALADYANFAQHIRPSPTSKIVSFGGSYSGALSAWLRFKYPDIINVAVSSSGPVHAQTNFPEYLTIVAQSLATTKTPCDAAIKKATEYYTSLLQTEDGRAKINTDFKTCSPIKSELDAVTFLEFLADTVAGFVQYNNDNNSYYPFNMNKMCEILTQGNIEVTFPQFVNIWNNFTDATCSDVSYADAIAQLQDVNPKAATAAGRTWYWQTCNEFGYFQSSIASPFSSLITLDYFVGMCQEVFEKNLNDVNLAVLKTNLNYKGKLIRANTSKTIFMNGSVDPWHALGVTIDSSDPSVPVVFMRGTAHCADLYPSRSSDIPTLTAGRQRVVAFLETWLNQ